MVLSIGSWKSSTLGARNVLENGPFLRRFIATGAFFPLVVFFLTFPFKTNCGGKQTLSIFEGTVTFSSFWLMMLRLQGFRHIFEA